MNGQDSIYLGSARGDDGSLSAAQSLTLAMANRHGLITGVTGSGKTVSLQALCEGFSRAGVPVFVADVKGDISGIATPGAERDVFKERAHDIGLADYSPAACPVEFWDAFGNAGHHIRTTIENMGPLLLGQLLELTTAQRGALLTVFKVASERKVQLHTLADLQDALSGIGHSPTSRYGTLSPASIAVIQRQLLALEMEGGDSLFGLPNFDINDFIRCAPNGQGIVNVLAADRLIQCPRIYATLLLWMLSELLARLPEIGDNPKPRLVFFFDEAHLLFGHNSRALLQKVEQIVRMIRSKGVGIYFITQDSLDIPERILGQLGNRIQHAMRAYTPHSLRSIRAAAETFRPNPTFDTQQALAELVTGETLMSMLDARGLPGIVQRTLMRPPAAHVGPLAVETRTKLIEHSPLRQKYCLTPKKTAPEAIDDSLMQTTPSSPARGGRAAVIVERRVRTTTRAISSDPCHPDNAVSSVAARLAARRVPAAPPATADSNPANPGQ